MSRLRTVMRRTLYFLLVATCCALGSMLAGYFMGKPPMWEDLFIGLTVSGVLTLKPWSFRRI